MSFYFRIALLIGLVILIVFFISTRLLPPMDVEVPHWAAVVIRVLSMIERIAVLAAIVYATWRLFLVLWPR